MVDRAALRKIVRLAGQVLALVALYLLGRHLVGNWDQIAPHLRQARPGYVLLAALPILAMQLLMPMGWWLALRSVGASLRGREAFRIYYRASIYRYLPGSLWYLPTRGYLAQQRGVPLAQFAPSMILELGFLLAVAGTLAGVAVAQRLDVPWLIAVSLACGLGIALALWRPDWVWRLLRRGPDAVPGHRRPLLALVAVYLGVWSAYGLSMAVLFLGMGALRALSAGDAAFAVGANAAAWLAGFLSLVPAGIGVREVSLAGLFQPLAPGTYVVLISLVQRTMEMGLEAVLWLIATAMRDSS